MCLFKYRYTGGEYEMYHFQKFRPTEVAEMFHFVGGSKILQELSSPIDVFFTTDKPAKYGKENSHTFCRYKGSVEKASDRTVRICCSYAEIV